MWKPLACVALICTVASPGIASDWTTVNWPPNPHTGVTQVQVDMDSLTTTLANQYHAVMKTFWMRRMHTDGAKVMGHVSIDCGTRTYVVDSGTKYDKDGTTLTTYSGDYRSSPIPPDTDFDAIRQLVCF